MADLTQLTEKVASELVLMDPTDLPAMAEMHTHLEELLGSAGGEAADTASRAKQMVEKIILREVDDATAALQGVNGLICQLQQIIKGSGGTSVPASGPDSGKAKLEKASAVAAPASAAMAVTPAESAESLAESPVNPDDVPLVGEFISEARGHIESAEAELLKLEEDPGNLEAVNAIFRSFHTIKGVAGFLNLRQIGALAHAAESLLDLARKGQLSVTAAVVDVVLESIDLMKALLIGLDEAAKSNAAPASMPRLGSLVERLHACATGQAPVKVEAAGVAPAAVKSDQPAKAGQFSPEATVKVATDRLDTLINMVGELVIAQSMVGQDMRELARRDQRAARNISHLGKITRELQELSMSMRMVPIQGVFQKMARLVRDLSHKVSKEIEFVVTGGETELDRNVVEAISDPLVHMVRNAVDHGVESPEARENAGKRRNGRVELRAYHQAGNIVIEIIDDGKGLNKAKILQKAVAAGIVAEGQQLTEAEIFKLIFHAGLSTAEKVTDVSGRGVGMDVVRKNVEALRGRIEIASTEGRGSTFTIRLPLTLAVIDGLVIRVGPQRYILPITSIDQSIQPKAEQLSTVQGRGEMCLVRGDLLPLFRLHHLFRLQPLNEDPTKALVVIVQNDQHRCGLLVDELLGQQQVVIKSLGDGVGQVPGVSGAAILGDGNVSLILDVPGLIALAQGK